LFGAPGACFGSIAASQKNPLQQKKQDVKPVKKKF
jgi:hypothetical protein